MIEEDDGEADEARGNPTKGVWRNTQRTRQTERAIPSRRPMDRPVKKGKAMLPPQWNGQDRPRDRSRTKGPKLNNLSTHMRLEIQTPSSIATKYDILSG